MADLTRAVADSHRLAPHQTGHSRQDPDGLKVAARRPESPLHAAADAHVPKLGVTLRYGFAAARQALVSPAAIPAALRALRVALLAVLPTQLRQVYLDGGDVAAATVARTAGGLTMAAFNPDQPRDEQGQWTSASALTVGSRIFRGGVSQGASVDFPGLVYVSTNRASAAQYGAVQEYEITARQTLVNLDNWNAPGAKQLVAHIAGLEARKMSRADYDDAATQVFLQGDRRIEPWLRRFGYTGIALGSDAALIGRLDTHAKLRTAAFNPSQARDEQGRWTDTGAGAGTVNTHSPEFKTWFGDSVVAHANGTPKVMYHATNFDVQEFRPGSHFGTAAAADKRFEDLYSFSKDIVNRDPGHFQVVPVYLAIEHPLRLPDLADLPPETSDMDPERDEAPASRAWENEGDLTTTLYERDIITRDEFWEYQYKRTERLFALLEEKGYDGIVYKNAYEDKGSDSYIIFHANQVKSVFNKGTFNKDSGLIAASFRTAKRTSRARIDFAFDRKTEAAIDWADRHAAELIDQISETSREAINNAVAEYLETGDWNDYKDEILAAVGDEARADLIARHESMVAVHAGQREAWDQAAEAGLLTGTEQREWIVVGDDKVCPICQGLEGKRARLGETYTGDDGDEYEGPPAHVKCRCSEGLV